jgi:hypothetical protein
VAVSPPETKPAHPLYRLATHHCSKLTPPEEASACLEDIDKAISSGQLAPVIPEVDPLACDSETDPARQHECHGWMGHDFAVSTGDAERCNVIPQEHIRASCKRRITVNDIKKLYALETPSGSPEP